jgi:hypothetical protein
MHIQSGSKPLSRFLRPIVFKQEKQNKTAYGIWKCKLKSSVWQSHTRRTDVWEKKWRHTLKWRLFKRKPCAYFGFSKQSPLSKRNVVTRPVRKRLTFKWCIRRWIQQSHETSRFCSHKQREDPALHRRMLIEYRKRFHIAPPPPTKSTRLASLHSGIPQTTVRSFVHNCLLLHPYKVQTVQALKPDDKPRCFQLVKDILAKF